MRGVSAVAHGLQPHHQVFAILLGRQRAHRADGQLDVLHQLIGLLEREDLGGGARLELLHQRLQPLQVLHLLLALGVAVHLFLRFELLRGGVVARAQLGIDLDVARDRLPLLAQRVPLAADVVVVRVRRERLDLGHERRQPLGRLLGELAPLEALLGGAARFVEAAIELRRPRLGHRRHAFPRRARLRRADR